jgi:hypothetical protein
VHTVHWRRANCALSDLPVDFGGPNGDRVRQRKNGTLRQRSKRPTRLTYAFSKKWDNLKAALALHFVYLLLRFTDPADHASNGSGHHGSRMDAKRTNLTLEPLRGDSSQHLEDFLRIELELASTFAKMAAAKTLPGPESGARLKKKAIEALETVNRFKDRLTEVARSEILERYLELQRLVSSL